MDVSPAHGEPQSLASSPLSWEACARPGSETPAPTEPRFAWLALLSAAVSMPHRMLSHLLRLFVLDDVAQQSESRLRERGSCCSCGAQPLPLVPLVPGGCSALAVECVLGRRGPGPKMTRKEEVALRTATSQSLVLLSALVLEGPPAAQSRASPAFSLRDPSLLCRPCPASSTPAAPAEGWASLWFWVSVPNTCLLLLPLGSRCGLGACGLCGLGSVDVEPLCPCCAEGQRPMACRGWLWGFGAPAPWALLLFLLSPVLIPLLPPLSCPCLRVHAQPHVLCPRGEERREAP